MDDEEIVSVPLMGSFLSNCTDRVDGEKFPMPGFRPLNGVLPFKFCLGRSPLSLPLYSFRPLNGVLPFKLTICPRITQQHWRFRPLNGVLPFK